MSPALRPRTLPHVTAALPGTGGVVRQHPDDFRVDELPAYGPSGSGDHVLAVLEKRELTTFEMIGRLAEALQVRAQDIGTAGLKDRHAVTTQQVSLPPPVTPEMVRALTLPGVTVLSAERHPHKLRTGHLRGNRFQLCIRQLPIGAAEAERRARAVLEELARPPGSPNWFGEQRFGARGDNAARGRALLLGEQGRGRPPRGRERRLLLSAYQSALFNVYLADRIGDALYRRVLPGDVLQKRDGRFAVSAGGGLFVCSDPVQDQERMEAGEVVPTGPMFGHRMKPAAPGSPAAAREEALLAAEELSLASFAPAGKLAEGTRRAIAVTLAEVTVRIVDEASIEVGFALPAGAYATAVLRELIKAPESSSDQPAGAIP